MEPWQHFVALDEDYAKQVDLPHAQRWPWDDSKGTYILSAAHELHCVVSSRPYQLDNVLICCSAYFERPLMRRTTMLRIKRGHMSI